MTDENQTQNDAEELEKYIEMNSVAHADPGNRDAPEERYQMLYKDDRDNVATGYITDTETDWYAEVSWRTDSYPRDGPQTYRVRQWFKRTEDHVADVDANTQISKHGAIDWMTEALFRHHDVDGVGTGSVDLYSPNTNERCTVVLGGVEPTSDD